MATKSRQVKKDTKNKESKFDPGLVRYAFYSLTSSMVLGLLFVYFFVWDSPAISHFLFYLAVFVNSLIPVFLWNRDALAKNKRFLGMLLGVMSVVSLSSLWVRNSFALLIAVFALPTAYSITLSVVHAGKKSLELSVRRLVTWPFILFLSWFGDLAAYIRHLKPSYIKNSRFGYYGARVLLGLFVASPFILTFVLLLSSADAVFQQLVRDLINKTFGRWFADFESFVVFVGKFFVALAVGIYFSIYNFSLWNPKSVLSKWLRKSSEKKEVIIKKSWNVVTASSFLFFLNLVFLTFVVVQSTYLFSGDNNVIGANAEFTYSEYARRGFLELVIVSGLVYLIGIILDLKVKATTQSQKLLFRTNFIALILSTLVISISSQMRLFLVESVYGFTVVRIWGHAFTAVIAILLALLLVALIAENSQRFISKSISYLFIVFFALGLLLPVDNFVANLNYRRYKGNGKIDVVYLLNLSTEASPVWFKVESDPTTSDLLKDAVRSKIHSRAVEVTKDEAWFKLNIWDAYLKRNVEKLSDSASTSESKVQDSLVSFLENYEDALLDGDYQKAYDTFWSDSTTAVDFTGLDKYTITSYSVSDSYTVDADSILSDTKSLFENSGYWDGVYVPIEFRFTPGHLDTKCTSDSVRVRIENGEWKIVSSSYLPLGKDLSLSRYRFSAGIDTQDPFANLESIYSDYGCE
ncbi:DUF4173 domain-containing protein [Candidatus Dojkabacteria bacterium]|uniref:DUF4173 domain-containing protein n=1 Tax=Candidatus Dojkabacteria bacterium TaxID=2099670 RepID=A0A955KW90_9BACT|nr:DUF4173 domain-containing protein [Candidatus Dojkabacteria bacterium]MCB9790828.1 DUF4173 domain-containing protein [Candidatus Nomurabacteria bacterium]